VATIEIAGERYFKTDCQRTLSYVVAYPSTDKSDCL
jgi:hypothetical protein